MCDEMWQLWASCVCYTCYQVEQSYLLAMAEAASNGEVELGVNIQKYAGQN